MNKTTLFCGAATTVVAAAMSLGACRPASGSQDADSIAFAITVYEDSAMSDSCEISQRLLVEYPVAADHSVAADSIRLWLRQLLADCAYPQLSDDAPKPTPFGGSPTDVEAMTRYYGDAGMHQMLEAVKPDPDDEFQWVPMGYSNGLEATVQVQTPRYVTYTTGYSIYTGGAHGAYIIDEETFRKSDGHHMGWDIIDTISARPTLNALIIEGLKEYFSTPDDPNGDLLNEELQFMELIENPDADLMSIIPLPSSAPALTAEGVSFVYQQYEIASYAAGLPSFVIPYDKAADILTPAAKELAGM